MAKGPRWPRGLEPGDASWCPGCAVKSRVPSCFPLFLPSDLRSLRPGCPVLCCPLVGALLARSIARGMGHSRPGGGLPARLSRPGQEVAELIRKHKAMMRCVLEDVRLVGLRLEGGTVLAWLRREEPGTGCDCR